MINIKKNMAPYLLLILIFSFSLALNSLAPFFADDYANSFIRGSSRKMSSFSDVFLNTKLVYLGWTGRFTSSFFVYLFTFLGKSYFNVINAAVFTFFIYGISKLTTRILSVSNIIIILFLSWFGLPVFGETIMWATGSMVYLWTVTICIFFLIPCKYLLDNEMLFKDSWKNNLYFFIFGVLAAGTLENLAPVILIILISIYSILKFKKFIIPKWFYSGGIGLLVGIPILLFSPGNKNREIIEGVGDSHSIDFKRIIYFFKTVLKEIYVHQQWLLVSFLVLAILGLFIWSNVKNSVVKNQLILSSIFFIASLASNFSMLMAPYFPLRTSFPGAVFLIISVMYLFDYIKAMTTNIKFVVGLLIPVTIILIYSMGVVNLQYFELKKQNLKRDELLHQNILNKNQQVVVPKFEIFTHPQYEQGSRHVFIRDITEDPKFWVNELLARYYGFNSIKAIDENKIPIETQLDVFPSLLVNEFSLNKNLSIENIKYVLQDNKVIFYFQLNPNVDPQMFLNKVLFFHAYVPEEDKQKFNKDEIPYGFLNWDVEPKIEKINDKIYFIKEVEKTINKFDKFVIGIYDLKTGNEGNVLELMNVILKKEK